ncbi:helix-turn-helix domain-containing protein [Pseudovibrio sp. Tun.PSC04-5.I4]|uniref:helix-turn-helix domain-containing protein n=1 Tax=Pseudovibrio sp. Tun.PSC04-5.I4 TaxID=1798213 RepID=UPI000880B277|nr:helix-turn-helix domain-containing protein [Pseudovibrio sp. Tun.PSC04-5.I4]SDQ18930.1 AraC-type DNA-binding protein [Pseudovibrio sp. Tun.PSC04-5.I4]
MIIWKLEPKSESLSHSIECYWFLEKQQGGQANSFPKLYPDPNAHMIVASPHEAYHYEAAGHTFRGQGTHWLLPHSQTYKMDHTHTSALLGIKFRVGALYALQPLQNQPMLDNIVDINFASLFQTSEQSELELLKSAQLNPEQCRDHLDELLQPWTALAKQDKHSALIKRALTLLPDHPISELGDRLSCTQRTLERNFLRVTGLTLKQCQSMNKLEALLEHLYQQGQGEIDWADVAFEFGFSDQPHLIRYLKAAIGETPGDYARLRDLTIDVYGGIDPL